MEWDRDGPDDWTSNEGYSITTAHIRHGFTVEKERILYGPSRGGAQRETIGRDAGAGAVKRLQRKAEIHKAALQESEAEGE